MKTVFAILACCSIVSIGGCASAKSTPEFGRTFSPRAVVAAQPKPPVSQSPISSTQRKIVESARTQIGASYTQEYFSIAYPDGDLPRDKNGKLQGACTDVVVRALRAVGVDLQKLMHLDMKRNFSLYPRRYKLRRPDKNIDHRRVPNQTVWMKRFAQSLPLEVSTSSKHWRAGDIVYWKFENGLDHCGIVSDKRNARGAPLVIHNLGGGAEQDVLTTWKIVGHFRVK